LADRRSAPGGPQYLSGGRGGLPCSAPFGAPSRGSNILWGHPTLPFSRNLRCRASARRLADTGLTPELSIQHECMDRAGLAVAHSCRVVAELSAARPHTLDSALALAPVLGGLAALRALGGWAWGGIPGWAWTGAGLRGRAVLAAGPRARARWLAPVGREAGVAPRVAVRALVARPARAAAVGPALRWGSPLPGGWPGPLSGGCSGSLPGGCSGPLPGGCSGPLPGRWPGSLSGGWPGSLGGGRSCSLARGWPGSLPGERSALGGAGRGVGERIVVGPLIEGGPTVARCGACLGGRLGHR
jgi:hypothetical protein